MNEKPIHFPIVMKGQASLVIQERPQMVGCENDRGTLNIHATETCEVCKDFCNCIPFPKVTIHNKCAQCNKPLPPGTWAERFQ